MCCRPSHLSANVCLHHRPHGTDGIANFATHFFVVCCLAQTNMATVNGAVTDAHGAAVAGAEVVAVQDATGVRMVVRSNDAGIYVFPAF